MAGRRSWKETTNQVHITVYETQALSQTNLTDADVRKIGRSASICDRGILELFDNDLRRDVIRSFHKKFANEKTAFASHNTTTLPEYIEAAYSIGKWSITRFRRLVEQLKKPCFAHVPDGSLLYDIESLEYAIDAESAANEEDEDGGEPCRDPVADMEVWTRYAVPVEGRDSVFPDLDSDSDEARANETDFESIRCSAVMHFRSKVEQAFQQMKAPYIYDAVYLLPKYEIGSVILEMIMPILIAKVPSYILEDELIPRLAVLNIIQTENKNSVPFLESLILVAKQYINKHTVNSMLEFSGHTQKSECVRIIVYNLSEKITSEGIVTSFVPVSIRGVDHFLAILELYCMDRAMQAQLNKEMGLEPEPDSDEEDPQHFIEFVAPSFYLFFFLAAAAGRAPSSTVVELIEFYSDPCVHYMPNSITPNHHRHFIAQMFRSVCGYNLGTIAWALVEKGWTPKNINCELQEAVELGHQNIVHLLLESLLKPDDKMEPSCLPLVYRKSSALSLLPVVARRFPKEAAWFLEQLSCIPIPACIPPGQGTEPEVRAKPVHGVLLGTLSLFDTIFFRRQAGSGSLQVWPRLVMNGLLRQAGSGKDDLETESLICAAPESLLTADAVHTPMFGRSWAPSTSPFIRLLAEDDPQITLQPVMRALMEFHWARGKFWFRFAVQFLVWMIYVPCLAYVCVSLVQKQNSFDTPYVGNNLIYYLSYVVVVLSCFFIMQEIRELHDYPKKYFQSGSNMLDTGIHFTILYVVIAGLYIGYFVQPILMSLVLIFCAIRIISHLRVLPSVGPLVRLWVTASVNILPILIPYGVMAMGFTIAFYIIEFQASQEDNGTPIHFQTIGVSVQSVLTMAMTDYSVLDYASNPQVFLLRFLFYVCFIIFLVNIIIALMTVNVADIHSNMNAAWLLEIAGIMVDLELFWPFPQRYDITADHHSSQFKLDVPARRHRTQKTPKRIQGGGAGKAVFPESSSRDTFLNGDDEVDRQSPEFLAQIRRKTIILYTWPQEFVIKTAWWPLMVCRALENASNDEDQDVGPDLQRRRGGKSEQDNGLSPMEDHYEIPETPNAWETFLTSIGISFGPKPENRITGLLDMDELPGVEVSSKIADDSGSGRRQTRKSILASASMASSPAKSVIRDEKKFNVIHEEDSSVKEDQQVTQAGRQSTAKVNKSVKIAPQAEASQSATKLSLLQNFSVNRDQDAIPSYNGSVKDATGESASGAVLNGPTAGAASIQPSLPKTPFEAVAEAFKVKPVRFGSLMEVEVGTNSNSIVQGDPYHQGTAVTGSRRPSIWTKILAPMTTALPSSSIIESIEGEARMESQMKSTVVGGNSIQNAEAILDTMRGIEYFMRQEAKMNRERIKRLEDFVETEVRDYQRDFKVQKEELQKATAEMGRIAILLEQRARGAPIEPGRGSMAKDIGHPAFSQPLATSSSLFPPSLK
ncbi:hypothetical protein BC830DRAFT_1100511 [Chytriomyces sp. MP71]|nr:hypothetical protein BC830DRAFT_1100511 [Chytriomyces sp. MP71]